MWLICRKAQEEILLICLRLVKYIICASLGCAMSSTGQLSMQYIPSFYYLELPSYDQFRVDLESPSGTGKVNGIAMEGG